MYNKLTDYNNKTKELESMENMLLTKLEISKRIDKESTQILNNYMDFMKTSILNELLNSTKIDYIYNKLCYESQSYLEIIDDKRKNNFHYLDCDTLSSMLDMIIIECISKSLTETYNEFQEGLDDLIDYVLNTDCFHDDIEETINRFTILNSTIS